MRVKLHLVFLRVMGGFWKAAQRAPLDPEEERISCQSFASHHLYV